MAQRTQFLEQNIQYEPNMMLENISLLCPKNDLPLTSKLHTHMAPLQHHELSLVPQVRSSAQLS